MASEPWIVRMQPRLDPVPDGEVAAVGVAQEDQAHDRLEVLVNLARPSTFPTYRILDLDVPEGSIVAAPTPVADSRQAGAHLLPMHLAIIAPSTVNPLERNIVINPAHREFDKVVPGAIRPFVLDRRLAVE